VAGLDAEAVAQAAIRLAGIVRRTPLEYSERLSARFGRPVLLKREDLQVCRSYKVRGAYNLISTLGSGERSRGVVCASAGNHGQGVAFACATLGIRGTVLVPTNTPRQKRSRIKDLGGELITVVLSGANYDEASAAAVEEAERTGAVYVHPFDDPRTIAGQGTVAVEVMSQYAEGYAERWGPELSGMVVPVGGGGLLSGVALWMRSRARGIYLVGAEPAGAASMQAALTNGGPIALDDLDTFVDGAAVGRVGRCTYPVVRDLVDGVVSVDEGAVCSEVLELYSTEGIIAEPAGALASAGLGAAGIPGEAPVVCIVSGGNNDVSRYADILERSLLYEGLRHYFLVTFSQEPGSLRSFLDDVLEAGEDIIAFEYVKKNNRETGPALVGIELEDAGDLVGLLQRMDASPLKVEPIEPGSPLFSFLL
jgi:threonine dehydratase